MNKLMLVLMLLAAPALAKTPDLMRGEASYYGSTRSPKLTAAHRVLPFGTQVEVVNRANGKRVIVVINDRGPFKRGRVIDVSYAAAKKLGMISSGVAPVQLLLVKKKKAKPATTPRARPARARQGD